MALEELTEIFDFVSLEFYKELENYIKNSRCVVLPSEWYENGPYSAMEAMALGKPLIVSNFKRAKYFSPFLGALI